MFIPLSHLITLEMAKETVVAKKMLAAKLDLLSPKHSFLSTFLLREKNKKDSFCRPYIDILPSHYQQFPVFFKEDDMAWLEGSSFLSTINPIRLIFIKLTHIFKILFEIKFEKRYLILKKIIGILWK